MRNFRVRIKEGRGTEEEANAETSVPCPFYRAKDSVNRIAERKPMRKILILVLCGILSRYMYNLPAYVSNVDTNADIVTFTDYMSENDWQIDGVGKWSEYDNAILVMFDCGTLDVADDVILGLF